MTQTTNPSSSPLFDVSAYAHRSLARLPAGEHGRFLKAWRLLGSGGILALVREGDVALSGAGVCEALLARSWAARHHDPRKMLHLASVGLEVAEGLKAGTWGGPEWRPCRRRPGVSWRTRSGWQAGPRRRTGRSRRRSGGWRTRATSI